MSELQSLKKAELSEICHRLGIHSLTKDTKKVLIEKLSEYISKNGDAGVEAVQAALDAEINEAEEATEKVVKNQEEDEEEDEEEEDDDEEDDENKDGDYQDGPPLNLKTYVVDPAIELYEQSYDKVLEFTDSLGITTVDINGELRESLSKSITLNYLELLLEFSILIYTFVPLVETSENSTIPQILKDNILYLANCTYKYPDVSKLFEYGSLATIIPWAFISIIGPLVTSYYINFTRRLITFEDDTEFFARIYAYDPFIFALSKVLFFFFLSKPAHFDIIKDGGFYGFVQNNTVILYDYYAKFAATLGAFPLIIGVANVAIALYSQFEEY